MDIAIFTFNPFAENTYVLYDDTKSCVIIDPGCMTLEERKDLTNFIEGQNLQPTHLLNTHGHIDHIFGNAYVSEKYQLPLTSHRGEQQVINMQPTVAQMYGLPLVPSPDITKYLDEGDVVSFGHTTLSVLFVPGHSPASIAFYHQETGTVIGGDVLFEGSIGRTDLPGGDFETLISNIKEKLFTLPDDVVVYPGHGPKTTIGQEKRSNPFLKE